MLSLFSTLLISAVTLLPTACSNPIDYPADLSNPIAASNITDIILPRAGPIPSPTKDKAMKCYYIYFPWSWINNRNCLNAMKKLPGGNAPSRDQHLFHVGGHYDGYKLPVTESSGDCQVTVFLIDEKKEQMSDWFTLHDRMSDLIWGCAYNKKEYYKGPTRGGSYLVGTTNVKKPKDGIKVRVRKTTGPAVEALDA
ncbi:MAG: hypothetical protein Q9169_004958 [Polycauliona sp. 2 TL-2023]